MRQLAIYDDIGTNIILGKTLDGKVITIYKCSKISKEFNCNGIPATVALANIIFEGVHFNCEEDIRFDEISCHYSNLDEWACINETNMSALSNKAIETRYKSPDKVSVDINEGYTIEIGIDTQMVSQGLVREEPDNIRNVHVKIINKNLNSFEKHRDKLH